MSPNPVAAALLREAFGEEARAVDAVPIAGDASARSYSRLRLQGAKAPTSAVLMHDPVTSSARSSDEIGVDAPASGEPAFVNMQRYLAAQGIGVPAIYATDLAAGWLLLEDVGDQALFAAAQLGSPEPVFRAAIKELLALQRAGKAHPDARCVAFRRQFDESLLRWELEHFVEFGARGTAAEQAAAAPTFNAIAGELGDAARRLSHRDFHGWNLHWQKGRVRVIDFQDALLAPSTYDLASLLTDRATPTVVTPPLETALVREFAEALGRDPAECRREYDLCALQRALKVVGRFHYLEEVKGKQGYVAMLPHTEATIARALESLRDGRAMRRDLARLLPSLQ